MAMIAKAASAPAPRSPASAYAALEFRATLAMLAALWLLAGVAWLFTVRQAHDMAGVALGLAQVATAMPFEVAAPLFLLMWVTMMAAMMLPTVAPFVLTHRAVAKGRGDGVATTLAFASGYLLIWSAAGVVPLALLAGFRFALAKGPAEGWLPYAVGAVFAVAGIYQFTPAKSICLRACETPFDFLMSHDFSGGVRSAVRAGLSHGAFCVGCCWALMLVLVAVGLMNLAWMVALAAVFWIEKHMRNGRTFSRVVGCVLVLLAVSILIYPGLIAVVAGGANHPAAPNM